MTVDFGVFPNPATDRVVLAGIQGNADVLIDVQGREVLALNNAVLNGRYELNVSDLQAGAYTIVVQGAQRGVQRLLIK